MKKENISKKISWDEDRNFRLNEYFKHTGLTQEEFALKMNYSQPNLSAILNNKRALGEKIVSKYLEPNFLDLDINWLLTGESSMLVKKNNGNVQNGNGGNVQNSGNNNTFNITNNEKNIKTHQEEIRIPYYDVDFAGGWNSEELFSNAYPSYYISAPEFERAEFACNLRGHSISKRIKSGSIVGLKEIHDWQTYFPTNELYGVITKNDLRTIKIVKRSKEEGFLDLIPDALPEYNNPPYESEKVPINFIQKMFQVVAWGFYERLVM